MTEEEREKFIALVSFGMDPSTVRTSWAWEHFEEAKLLNAFFDELIGVVKSTLVGKK